MKFFKNSKKFYKKSGFTLIEALVAISILMIAIASPMLLAQKSLSTATLSKDQMTATFLAQDAIEAVKNIRDQIAINENAQDVYGDWLENNLLNPCICKDENSCNFDNKEKLTFCFIDTTKDGWAPNNDSINPGVLNLTNESGKLKITYKEKEGEKHFEKYDYSGPDFSKFTRYINIRKTNELNGNEAIVSVRVFWESTSGQQKIELQDFIYNYSANFEDKE